MAEQCRGVTGLGIRCKMTVRGSPYCRYHQAQGEYLPECGEEPITTQQTKREITPRRVNRRQQFAPLEETVFKASPEVRELTEEQEILTDIPIMEKEEEEGETIVGLFEEDFFLIGEDFDLLDQLLDLSPEEYAESSYDDLYSTALIFGFKPEILPIRQPRRQHLRIAREELLTYIDDFINGRITEESLTPEGIIKYYYVYPPETEEEPVHQHPHVEDIKGEPCCICLDEDVKPGELLTCKHAVCVPCLKQLTKDECPACRAKLTGPTVTQDIAHAITTRKAAGKITEENANLLVAMALQENPDADPVALYDRFYQAL